MTRDRKPLNLGEEEDVSQRRRDTKLAEAQRISDLQFVMASPQGRRFVWSELARAGIYLTSFVSEQPTTTAFREGARAHGLDLLGRITKHCPQLFLQMQQEAIEKGDPQ